METTATTKATNAADAAAHKCPSCGEAKATGRVPKIVAWTVIPVMWTAMIGFGACLAILVPANLVLIPCWLMVASSLGPLAREMLDPKCEGCGEPRGFSSSAAAPWKKTTTASSNIARRTSRPTHEGAMEGGLV
jgi:hypothetical protein